MSEDVQLLLICIVCVEYLDGVEKGEETSVDNKINRMRKVHEQVEGFEFFLELFLSLDLIAPTLG